MTLAEGGGYEQFENRMDADFPAKLALVQAQFPQGSSRRLLDVGCGKGYFVKLARDCGLDAHGIDLSTSGVAHANDVLGVPAIAGTLSERKYELGHFDAATFWATIEHLADPLAMLGDIRDTLRPGGRLFMDTGVGDDWLDRTLPGHVQWYDPPQHLFVFSVAGVRIALEKSGFEIVSIDPHFERSPARRIVKRVRNGTAALGLAATSKLAGLSSGPFAFTRFQMGSLMSIVAARRD